MKRVLQEALLVGIASAILAFAANAISPRGLSLKANYFPGDAGKFPVAPVASGTANLPPAETLAQRFEKLGLQLAESNQVTQLFHDPRREQGLVVFIDARNDEHYQAGHIPGAYQFDRFHAMDYLPTITPVCLAAEQIIFYCGGGDCEESEHAALSVRDAMTLPKEKIFVYGGGMTEWQLNRMPIEIGARNSGNLTNSPPANGPKP